MRLCAVLALLVIISSAVAQGSWELRGDDAKPERLLIVEGVVTVTAGDPAAQFPRYLNELGVKTIRIKFTDTGGERRKLSVVWTGGTQGPDKFAVSIDGIAVGVSRTMDLKRLHEFWQRDDFTLKLAAGSEHVLEIASLTGYSSSVELAGIRLSPVDAPDYQPLCYESIGSLEAYERSLGARGTMVDSAHICIFAPKESEVEAKALSAFLEKAYGEMKAIYGIDTLFKFSVEHYPLGHKRGWGGISGKGTIGYTTEALARWKEYGTGNWRGFAGYTEEMSHGFKQYYRCDGTYEALGVAVQEDIMRRLVSSDIADEFWLPEHRQWDETHKAYLAAGRKNPDPEKYPWNVLYTRILNDVFLKLRTEYGDRFWPDFFATVRQMEYPLHRAQKTERMKTYVAIFSAMFGRDMTREFEDFGIDLNADPPWGWETYK